MASVGKRKVVAAIVAQDVIYLHHQQQKSVVNCLGRKIIKRQTNCLNQVAKVARHNFFTKAINCLEEPQIVEV